VAFRRGFKKEATATTREMRGELNLKQTDRLDPFELAGLLEIEVLGLSTYAAHAPDVVRHLSSVDQSAFSGMTVFDGLRRVVVFNDAHTDGRQSNNICHELSHGLLLHPASPAMDDRGCRLWNQDIEDEADWLAGCLLVPEEAALMIVARGLSDGDAATMLGVSTALIRMRVNMTGARQRVERGRARRVR
jgi:Zn-dependent peptidase ImmA (M78 family)